MTSTTTTPSFALVPSLEAPWQDVDRSFERFCLTAGIGAIEQMLRDDARQLTGVPYSRGEHRVGRAGARPKARSAFTAARSPWIGRACAPTTGVKSSCRPGRRRLAWTVGDEPDADQRLDAQTAARCATAGG
jgi:hypothetical protein